jgi:catechol 2,3-dioxygenase-like lactoylglutathione lyase family enzyme
MATQISTKGIHHIRLTVTDVPRAQRLYTELLGFQLAVELPTGVILTDGTVLLGLRATPEPERAGNSDRFDENRVGLDHLSFRVDSKAELERAVRLFDEFDIPHGEITDLGPDFGIHILVFRDPDNFQLELTALYD